MLYHYVPELEAYGRAENGTFLQNPLYRKHLSLLVDYIKNSYISTNERLGLKSREITFDLIWALFKPNSIVYGECFGTKKPRCIRFDYGEVKTLDDGTKYYHVEGQYLDFDGKDFGLASTALGIHKFRGTKRIDKLETFPLKYHPNEKEVRCELIDCGVKFLALRGMHHRQYEGVAFVMKQGKIAKVSVNGRIMVDAPFFFQENPNYTKPRIDEFGKSSDGWTMFDLSKKPDKVKRNAMDPAAVNDDDLLLCSPSVLGFSFGSKLWCKYFSSCVHRLESEADLSRYSGICGCWHQQYCLEP